MADSRFSLQKFSLSASDTSVTAATEEISIFASFEGRVVSAFEIRVDIMSITTELKGYINLIGGIPVDADLKASYHSDAKAIAQVAENIDSVARLRAAANIGADIYGDSEMELQVDASAMPHLLIGSSCSAEAGFNTSTRLGAFYPNELFMVGILSAGADLAEYEEEVFLLDVEMPVGAELRINTEDYTVTLDGENILHLQEGDWLRLSRGLMSAHVDSGSRGILSGEISYKERWL